MTVTRGFMTPEAKLICGYCGNRWNPIRVTVEDEENGVAYKTEADYCPYCGEYNGECDVDLPQGEAS